MGVTEAQHQSQLVWIVQIWPPFSPHSGSIPRELVHSYALGCLWIVTVCCNTAGRHGQSFWRPHAYTSNEQSKMATALTPQTDVTSEKVTWLMENPRQQSRPAYRKQNRLKTNIIFFLFFFSLFSFLFLHIFISLNLKLVTHLSIISMVILHT